MFSSTQPGRFVSPCTLKSSKYSTQLHRILNKSTTRTEYQHGCGWTMKRQLPKKNVNGKANQATLELLCSQSKFTLPHCSTSYQLKHGHFFWLGKNNIEDAAFEFQSGIIPPSLRISCMNNWWHCLGSIPRVGYVRLQWTLFY